MTPQDIVPLLFDSPEQYELAQAAYFTLTETKCRGVYGVGLPCKNHFCPGCCAVQATIMANRILESTHPFYLVRWTEEPRASSQIHTGAEDWFLSFPKGVANLASRFDYGYETEPDEARNYPTYFRVGVLGLPARLEDGDDLLEQDIVCADGKRFSRLTKRAGVVESVQLADKDAVIRTMLKPSESSGIRTVYTVEYEPTQFVRAVRHVNDRYSRLGYTAKVSK